MKSRSAFEFTIRKMLRENRKLYFWTFTFREVHSQKDVMRLWNQFSDAVEAEAWIPWCACAGAA